MHSNVLPNFSLLAYSSRLILLRLLSLTSSSLSPSTPSPSYSSFYCVLFFALSFFSISILALFLSLSTLLSPSLLYSLPLYSTLSLFGNAALLLALLFPIYASLLKCPFFFPPFSLSLIGWFPFLLFFSLLIVSLPSHFPFSFVPF